MGSWKLSLHHKTECKNQPKMRLKLREVIAYPNDMSSSRMQKGNYIVGTQHRIVLSTLISLIIQALTQNCKIEVQSHMFRHFSLLSSHSHIIFLLLLAVPHALNSWTLSLSLSLSQLRPSLVQLASWPYHRPASRQVCVRGCVSANVSGCFCLIVLDSSSWEELGCNETQAWDSWVLPKQKNPGHM